MAGEEEDVVMEPAEKAGEESSEDDIEIVPKSADGYWLEHGDETPVSFATLPYFKTEDESVPEKVVYVRGTQDNGMRLYMRAMAWKLELTKDVKPVFHLKTEKYWIELLKPRKSYEETIRSIISVGYFLNYALLNPDDPEKAAWNHIKDLFPSWEVAPNRNDLASHLHVVRHLAASDERLATSSALQFIDTGVSKKRLASAAEAPRPTSRKGMYISDDEDEGHGEPEHKRSKFEVDDLTAGGEMDGYGEEAEDDVGDLSETVCCICDNGGSVICCDGPCMRSFHLNKGAGGAEDSNCSTLGFSKAEAERTDKFFCPNCKFKVHQCYACGRLGCSDDKAGAAQEVFVCDAAMCGHFYHPNCVAELILKDKDANEQAALAESIKEGKGFTCPMHKCFKCGKWEVKEDRDLQFGVCRRCPRVWHRKCLPFSIPDDASDEDENDENDDPQRAWDNLLPNRILVYCQRHQIIPRLGTPARNHVKFPEGSLPSSKKVSVKSRPEQQEIRTKLIKTSSKKESDSLKGASGQKTARVSDVDGVKRKKLTGQVRVSTKFKLDQDGSTITRVSTPKATAEGPFLIKGRTTTTKQDWSLQEDSQKLSRLPSLSKGRAEGVVSKPSTARESALRQLQQQKAKPPVMKTVIIDVGTKNMINELIEKTKALVTMESVLRKQDIPGCYRRISKNPDKKYSLFKIESITKGMRKAVETLETGGSIEDAKAKCSPDYIRYIEVCRNDLRVYLAPFLHGARYTSYGRHFTKSEKLEEIVDRVCCYVDKGDMIVDFCCGANEFSLFMRKKLEETGKKCDYKNFDLIQTRNDFKFSKRDWFLVRPDELPDGGRLIMGLNPPFGLKASLANQFIDHALKFKPKLLILIVPKETERLDRKRDPYDIMWEDPDLLSGQSFYLPGSVDVNENPLNDWNVVAPPLYLWSRPDWTPKHKEIALSQGHISLTSGSRFVGPPWRPPLRPTSPSSLMNFNVEQSEDLPAPVDIWEGEEKKRNSLTVFRKVEEPAPVQLWEGEEKKRNLYRKVEEPAPVELWEGEEKKRNLFRKVEEQSGVQDREPKLEKSSSVKLKDKIKNSIESLDSRKKENSASAPDTVVKDDGSNSLKANTTIKSSNKDVSVQQKLLEEKVSGPSKKLQEASQLKQESFNNAKKGDLSRGKSSEGQSYEHAAQKADKARLVSHQSPERSRRSSEMRPDSLRSDRKPNDRYGRGEDTRGDPARDTHQYRRASEKHRPTAEADGRRSPNRHGRYDSGRRKSPDKYERHSNRHGEDRRTSPERSRHSSLANEQRRESPGKSGPSSVVDLSTFFSSSDAKTDRSRDYDDFSRKSSGKDYPDSSYRGRSPSRNHALEDGKRPWVDIESYQGVPEGHLHTNERLNADYLNPALSKTSYNDRAPYGLSSSEAQMSSLGRQYYDNIAPGARRQDAYDLQMSRLYNDAAGARQSRPTDFYQPELARERVALDRYGGQLRTEDPYRASAGGGLGALPERNVPPAWPAAMPPPNLYSSGYGAQVQQQAPLGIGDPSRLPGHGLYENRLVQTPNVQPQYPSGQGRYPGQANRQFTGGWYDD